VGPLSTALPDPTLAHFRYEAAEHLLPVEDPILGGPRNAAGCGLLDVDVFGVVFRVVLYVERYSGNGDYFAGHPTDALLCQDVVEVVGEGFILVYWG